MRSKGIYFESVIMIEEQRREICDNNTNRSIWKIELDRAFTFFLHATIRAEVENIAKNNILMEMEAKRNLKFFFLEKFDFVRTTLKTKTENNFKQWTNGLKVSYCS